jgi:hypothetical protein
MPHPPAPSRSASAIFPSCSCAISTRRLKLLPMPATFLDACLRADKDGAEAIIGLAGEV